MSADAVETSLQDLCHDVRLLWQQAGGPSLRALSNQVGLGKSQIGAILRGHIRQPPDWDVLKRLIESFSRYAREHDRMRHVSLSTGVDEFWRPRYAALEFTVRTARQRGMSSALTARPVDFAEEAILAGQQYLNGNGNGRVPSHVVPRQLPPPMPHFTSRQDELAALTTHAEGVSPVAVAVIDGMPGIGKTALALSWAHQAAERFPDGQLYVNLRGFDGTGSPMSAAEAVRVFLDGLQVPVQEIPESFDAQVGLYRTTLANRRMLVLIDNARSAEQVRPLIPGGRGSAVLVTSRVRLSSLVAIEGALPITLCLLPVGDSRRLLGRRLGHDRLIDERPAVEEIVSRCAGLPLALAIVAANAAGRPALSLDRLAAELRDASADLHSTKTNLDALTLKDSVDVRAVFKWSYDALTDGAARLFRLLAAHPAPQITAAAAAKLAAEPSSARALIAELVHNNLLVESGPDRYMLHDLLRTYAIQLAAGAMC